MTKNRNVKKERRNFKKKEEDELTEGYNTLIKGKGKVFLLHARCDPEGG